MLRSCSLACNVAAHCRSLSVLLEIAIALSKPPDLEKLFTYFMICFLQTCNLYFVCYYRRYVTESDRCCLRAYAVRCALKLVNSAKEPAQQRHLLMFPLIHFMDKLSTLDVRVNWRLLVLRLFGVPMDNANVLNNAAVAYASVANWARQQPQMITMVCCCCCY